MPILIGFLTVILIVNCLFLILLVLIQLPKKEAGIGMAFGGGATETLFGPGSGNVLTKATKYCAGLFMGLSLVLSVLNVHASRKTNTSLTQELEKRAGAPVAGAAARATNAAATQGTTSGTPGLMLTSSNVAPAAPVTTNAPAGE